MYLKTSFKNRTHLEENETAFYQGCFDIVYWIIILGAAGPGADKIIMIPGFDDIFGGKT